VRSSVTLEAATPDEAPVLANLLGLYMHDLSDVFSIQVGADGAFRYEKLPLFWSEPDTHFPFLIYSGARLAGFALVTRGSPVTDDPEKLDVAEFFVLRGYRRKGVGRQAACLLWDRLPGAWVVRVAEANRAGLPFWSATIGEYTGGAFSESRRPGWHVFSFTSANVRRA
jgi:predicted acetyltransferase